MLQYWSKNSSKSIILFIDEIDSLVGDTLISVLRQLRSGYTKRPQSFPQSLCLIGVRDVRDYRIWSDEQQSMVLGGSAFNIKAKSLRLNDFTANPIYQEVLPRELTYSTQLTMPQQQLWYVNPDGSINMHKMLTEFTQFYRENSAIWLDKFAYKESGPHLFTMAFLQCIINACPSELPERSRGGGKIHREYALGIDRVDMLIKWQTQRIVIELKVWRSEAKTLISGLEQTAKYMDASNATEGHLIIFDGRAKTWDEKIYHRQENFAGKTINIWGM